MEDREVENCFRVAGISSIWNRQNYTKVGAWSFETTDTPDRASMNIS